jgi:hypothetical protein
MAPRKHALPNTGDRFGRWTVLRTFSNAREVFVRCRCDCGNESDVRFGNLHRGGSRSCGCRNREATAKRNTKHGQAGTRLHRIWKSMHTRCTNPRVPGYRHYGAMGVRVCDAWSAFAEFHKWAIANGYSDDLEIDRINVTGNYEPANCRFVTHIENSRNKRRHRRFTAFNETKTLAEWAEDARCAVKQRCLVHRLNRGWLPERALTAPSEASVA